MLLDQDTTDMAWLDDLLHGTPSAEEQSIAYAISPEGRAAALAEEREWLAMETAARELRYGRKVHQYEGPKVGKVWVHPDSYSARHPLPPEAPSKEDSALLAARPLQLSMFPREVGQPPKPAPITRRSSSTERTAWGNWHERTEQLAAASRARKRIMQYGRKLHIIHNNTEA